MARIIRKEYDANQYKKLREENPEFTFHEAGTLSYINDETEEIARMATEKKENASMSGAITLLNERLQVMKAIRENFKLTEPQPEPEEEDNWDEFLDGGNKRAVDYLVDPSKIGITFAAPKKFYFEEKIKFGIESIYKTVEGENLILADKCGCLFKEDGTLVVRVNGCTRITRKEGVNICIQYLRDNWVHNPMWTPRPVYEDKFLELLTERLNDHLFLGDWDGVFTPEIEQDILEELNKFSDSDEYRTLLDEWYTLENYFTSTITAHLKENQ